MELVNRLDCWCRMSFNLNDNHVMLKSSCNIYLCVLCNKYFITIFVFFFYFALSENEKHLYNLLLI